MFFDRSRTTFGCGGGWSSSTIFPVVVFHASSLNRSAPSADRSGPRPVDLGVCLAESLAPAPGSSWSRSGVDARFERLDHLKGHALLSEQDPKALAALASAALGNGCAVLQRHEWDSQRSLSFPGARRALGPGATALGGPGPRRRALPHHQPRAAPPTKVGQQGRRDASAAM